MQLEVQDRFGVFSMKKLSRPYWDDHDILDKAPGTFGELIPFDSMTEEQHIEHLLKSTQKWGVVIPV